MKPIPPKIPPDINARVIQTGKIKSDTDVIISSTSGQISLSAPSVVNSYSLKFPGSQGTSNTVLKNDGLGNLSWSNAAGGSDTQIQFNDNGNLNGSSNLTFSRSYVLKNNLSVNDYTGPTENHNQCVSLSNDGTVLAVGINDDNNDVGATWIFNYINGSWTEIIKLIANDYIGTPSQGQSICLSGDGLTLAVGGPYDNGNGATWIFKNIDGTWTQMNKLIGTDNIGNPFQGWSVSLSYDGSILAVGGKGDDSNIGATWVFMQQDGSWENTPVQFKLIGTDYVDIPQQGQSVSLSSDGTLLAIGGPGDNGSIGATWIFAYSNGTWAQVNKLIGNDYIGSSFQGNSVSLSGDGNILAVGGNQDDSNIGATWIFSKQGNSWTNNPLQVKLIGTGYTNPASQGFSVSLSSDGIFLAVGGPSNYPDGLGSTWVFKKISNIWTQIGILTSAITGILPGGQGNSVSFSSDGNILAVSSRFAFNYTYSPFNIFENVETLFVNNLSVASAIGFFGKTPVPQQTATADVDSILALLKAYGLSA